MPQFTGDLLHPRGIGRAFQDADRSGVPAEREPGKGIYYVQLVTHDSGLVCRPIKYTGNAMTVNIG